MTNKNNSGKAASSHVTCEHCRHAVLHRYTDAPRDPLLADCRKKPQPYNPRFPFVVEVARTPRHCASYEYDARPKHIESRENRRVL